MAATARRKITITYSNDVEGEQVLNAANNTASPAMIQLVTLEDGENVFQKPEGATAVTLVKPTDNTSEIHFGFADGTRLHDTDPDTFSLHADANEIVLFLGPDPAGEEVPSVTDDLPGVRLFWS
jgi:hypothetical protein